MTPKLTFLLLVLVLFQTVAIAQKAAVTDDTITDQVRLKLTSDYDVKGGAIQVDVKDGVVTISGSVEMPKQREKAEKLARKVKGVKNVVNKLEIKSRVPTR
jgi:osmotically-inducible protein OsmY